MTPKLLTEIVVPEALTSSGGAPKPGGTANLNFSVPSTEGNPLTSKLVVTSIPEEVQREYIPSVSCPVLLNRVLKNWLLGSRSGSAGSLGDVAVRV